MAFLQLLGLTLGVPVFVGLLAATGKGVRRPLLSFAIPLWIASVFLPLLLFYASMSLVPRWKGAAHCGWFDGFFMGKTALTPVVLFATWALFRWELLRHEKEAPPRMVVLGVFCGAITSVLCVTFGFTCLAQPRETLLLVCYIPVWYCLRALQLVQRSAIPVLDFVLAAVGMLPFWIWGGWWSREVYESLPNEPGNCFVVTAAGRGHNCLVGPFFEVEQDGSRRIANRQLETFWEFESMWRTRWPLAYRLFRVCYDCVGPWVAARITSGWRADVVFLALKPLEWIARIACRVCFREAPPADR